MTVSVTHDTVLRIKRDKTLAMVHKRTKSMVDRRYHAVPTSNSEAPHATENCGAVAPRRRGVVQHLSASDIHFRLRARAVREKVHRPCAKFEGPKILGGQQRRAAAEWPCSQGGRVPREQQ